MSYYTPGLYAEEAAGLRASLDLHGLDYDIQAAADLGTWHRNIAAKPSFLLEKTRKHRRPIVWLDADARVKRPPDLFGELAADGVDVGVHLHNGYQVASGTVFIGDTRGGRAFAHRWYQVQKRHPEMIDQRTAALALQETHGLRVRWLPPEYCCIWDLTRERNPGIRPVIEHFQASRKALKGKQ